MKKYIGRTFYFQKISIETISGTGINPPNQTVLCRNRRIGQYTVPVVIATDDFVKDKQSKKLLVPCLGMRGYFHFQPNLLVDRMKFAESWFGDLPAWTMEPNTRQENKFINKLNLSL